MNNTDIYQLISLDIFFNEWQIKFLDICYDYNLFIDKKIPLEKREIKKILRYVIVDYFINKIKENKRVVFLMERNVVLPLNEYYDVNIAFKEFIKVHRLLSKSFPANFVLWSDNMRYMTKTELNNYIFLYCRDKWNFKNDLLKEFLLKNGINENVLSKSPL